MLNLCVVLFVKQLFLLKFVIVKLWFIIGLGGRSWPEEIHQFFKYIVTSLHQCLICGARRFW